MPSLPLSILEICISLSCPFSFFKPSTINYRASGLCQTERPSQGGNLLGRFLPQPGAIERPAFVHQNILLAEGLGWLSKADLSLPLRHDRPQSRTTSNRLIY